MNHSVGLDLGTHPKTAEILPFALNPAPPDLFGAGLTVALHCIARGFGQRHGIECAVHPGFELLGLPASHAAALIWIVEEALANAVQHGAATRVDIILGFEFGHCLLRIRDDGKGFRARALGRSAAGVTGMRLRAMALGGQFDLGSAPGRGTRIQVFFPVTWGAGATNTRRLLKGADAHI